MTDWSLPALTSIYTNILTEIKNRDIDLALQFDGTTSTSIPTGAIRFDSSAGRWKKWNGTAWAELVATYALTGLSTTGAASIGTTLGVTGVATLSGGGTSTTPTTDNNSTNIATTAFVVGQASATAPVMNGMAAVGTSFRYARQDHVHPTDTTRAPLASPTFTGSVTIPAGASIAGYARLASPTFTGTVTIPSGASISGYAALASPTFTGTPAAPTATAGTNTTQLATTAFVSSAVGSITTTPAGAVDYFAMSTAPTGYIKANGAAISRSTYSALFAAIGTTFGNGNGSTTFNVPDLRGEFLRGWDDSRGVDSGRGFGSAQAATAFTDIIYQAAKIESIINPDTTSAYSTPPGNNGAGMAGYTRNGTYYYVRPRNIALLACIKF
jgi:hypothetical protein